MDDMIDLKIEQQSLPSKTEPTDDELATPLLDQETVICNSEDQLTMIDEQHTSIKECNDTNCDVIQPCNTKDSEVTSSQYLTAQSTITTISERSWDFDSFNTEIVIHGSHDQIDNSTSADTIIDSDEIEIKPPTEETQKSDEYSIPKYEYVFCVAAIHKTTPNSSKLFAISKIDTKVDVKSDGSSLNGYVADRSGSSSNSTMQSAFLVKNDFGNSTKFSGQIDEPFLVPKVPQESFMSISSSSSSTGGILLNQPKFKSNDILLSKNVYTYPEHFICHKCNHLYSGLSDYNMDIKDFKTVSQTNSCVRKSRSRKINKSSNTNNNCSSKKSLKKTKQNTENICDKETDIKMEEIQNKDMEIDPIENPVKESISFDIGNKVFAYWVADKMFYPATIIDKMSSKYKVEFLSDYYVKQLNIEGLVHSTALKVESSVAIFDTVSQEYRVGEIVSINEVPNAEELTYTIDLDSENVVVPFEKLVLDVEKARMLQDKNVIKNYERLSMSNVSEGKRLRLSRSTNTKTVNNNVTKTSSKRKKFRQAEETNKKRKCLFPEEPDPRDIPSTSTGITRSEDYNISVKLGSSDSDFDHIREDLTTVNMNQLKNSDIDSEHSSPDKSHSIMMSPINKTKIFNGLHFVLSYAKYKRIPMHDSDQGADNEFSLQSEFFKPHKMFKKQLSNLIVKYGGSAHRYLNLIPKSHYKYTYMITDTPSQTCNFFLSLSLGIPSYHHKYIEQAISQKIPFPEFLANNNIQPLPNGWAVEKKAVVFRSPATVHSSIFDGYIIYLALSDEPKREFFAGILRFCGAIVYTSWERGVSMPLTRHMTVIVTDENCPVSIMHEKVPKLSILWVIQGLICESARPINGHESYIAIHDE